MRPIIPMTFATLLGALVLTMGLMCLSVAPTASAADTGPGLFRGSSPTAGAVQARLPSPELQVVLVQLALSGINQANLAGDYSVFRKLASTSFQALNSPEQMMQGFKGFRDSGVDLSSVVLYPIRWKNPPAIENGVLRLAGTIPSRPQETLFDLAWVVEGGRWRLAGISVALSPSAR